LRRCDLHGPACSCSDTGSGDRRVIVTVVAGAPEKLGASCVDLLALDDPAAALTLIDHVPIFPPTAFHSIAIERRRRVWPDIAAARGGVAGLGRQRVSVGSAA
jgi:hypothetical protein